MRFNRLGFWLASGMFLLTLAAPQHLLAQDFKVNSTGDREDANQGDGKCDTGNR